MRFFKVLFWMCVCAAVAYGGYFAYERWWNSDLAGTVEGISVKAIQDGSSELVGKVGDAAKESASNYIKGAAAGIFYSLGEKLNSFAASIVGEANEPRETHVVASSSDAGTETVSEESSNDSAASSNTSGGAISLEYTARNEYLTPPPFATIVAKTRVPFSFSINRAGVSYLINWGDGTVSKGVVPSGNSFIVSHEWEKQGDYMAQVDIREDGAQKYFYSFPVRIYE